MNLQPLLVPPKSAPDISVYTSVEAPDEFLIYYGLSLVERVNRRTDEFWVKLLASRLYNLRFNVSSLVETFKYAHTTLRRWGLALQSGDRERIIAALSGQGPERKVTSAIERYIRHRFRKLYGHRRDYSRQIAAEVAEYWECTLSAERLRWIFKDERTRLKGEAKVEDGPSSSEPEAEESRASSGDIEGQPEDVLPSSRNYSLWPAMALGVGDGVHQSVFCHHAGLALIGADVEGYLKGWEDPKSRGLLRQFCAQLLSGALNHEQSKLLHSGSLGIMIGSVIQSVNYQRLLSDELATPANIERLLTLNVNFVDIAGHRAFYYDPHTKDYTGELKILKGWCGSQHTISKVLIMDFIHALDGTPVWVRHFDNFDDVRKRFFACREAFFRNLDGQITSGMIWIFDRALYSLETLHEIRALGDHFVTWEKGYAKDGWKEDQEVRCFFRLRYRNNRTDAITYGFEYQEIQWSKDSSVRQFIVRAKGSPLGRKEIEVSILCSHATCNSEEAIWWMFNRWVQENDLGYLVRHHGIGELTSRAYETYLEAATSVEDRDVDSREYKALKSQREQAQGKLGRLLVKRHRSRGVNQALEQLSKEKEKLRQERQQLLDHLSQLREADLDTVPIILIQQTTQMAERLQQKFRRHSEKDRKAKERAKYNQEITKLGAQLDQIEVKLADIPHKESRLKALQEAGYVRLNTARKAFMDALRISCRNLFYQASAPFRHRYDNHRDDHDRYRALLRSAGIITQNERGIEICLLPDMDMPPKVRKIIDKYLAERTRQINRSHFAQESSNQITIRLSDPAADIFTHVTVPA